jgi:hypothetical protein
MLHGTREIAGRKFDAAKPHKTTARIGVENNCTGAKSMIP